MRETLTGGSFPAGFGKPRTDLKFRVNSTSFIPRPEKGGAGGWLAHRPPHPPGWPGQIAGSRTSEEDMHQAFREGVQLRNPGTTCFLSLSGPSWSLPW